MLEELHVRDLALIEDVWLQFGPGMTALTGETGAGKTALVEALQLLVGERADSSLVRAGAAETAVEGRFVVDGEEILAQRKVSAEGRSRCQLGGGMATVGALEEALGPLVDLHGQHEHQGLLKPTRHAGYLDRFAGPDAAAAVAAYSEAFDALTEARGAADIAAADIADRDRRLEQLSQVAREIDAVAPEEDEDVALEARLPALRHAEKLAEAVSVAWERVHGEPGAADWLSESLAALGRVEGLDPALDAVASDLTGAVHEVEDAGARLRDYAEGLTHDPRELDAAESRMAALSDLRRKYGPTLVDVLERRRDTETAIGQLEDAGATLADVEARVVAAEMDLRAAADRLLRARRDASKPFEDALAAAAKDLAMSSAVFGVAFTELAFESWTRTGPERVEFLFSASAGEEPRPLARIASGGEVSRVMLALKGVLGAADDVPVLVFDEVDAGIGGATANSVGRRLAELAHDHQVLVVTHLAQVAAYADHQIVVAKEDRDGRSVTSARVVEGDERVSEIARMLSGGDSDSVVTHARELLETARKAGAA